MIGANLLKYNYTQKYNLFDVETGGLNLISSIPTQVSWMIFSLKEQFELHDHYIYWPKSELPMSKGAAAVTRFNYDIYKERAEDPKKILEKFEDYLYSRDYKIVGHNILGYDTMIINAWRRKLGLKPRYDYILGRTYDTLALSKAMKLDIKPDLTSDEAFLAWQYKILGIIKRGLRTSISNMLKEFNIQFNENELHNAGVDIIKNAEIFKKLIAVYEI